MGEAAYLNLVRDILREGEERIGRNGRTFGVFGAQLKFDLQKGFPLLTTKRVFWRGVVEELLWFLRGETDAKILADKGVHIWDGNTTREFLDSRGLKEYPEGECGPIYGRQWRAFGYRYPELDGTVDQVQYVLSELTANPMSRRAVISAWNPLQLDAMCLPPCHVMYIFNVSADGRLSCMMTQRSADLMAGVPFNIASTALLTTLFAGLLGLKPGKIVINLGDVHIYEEHLAGAAEQVEREMRIPPKLRILREFPDVSSSVGEKIAWLESLTAEEILVDGYNPHPGIKYPMIQ